MVTAEDVGCRINVDLVDRDGAIRETAARAEQALLREGATDGDTRLSFLKKALVGGGTLIGAGGVSGALAPVALASGRPPSSFGALHFGSGDIGILNFALTLEYLERDFYDLATAQGAITDPQTRIFLQTVTADERAHVKFLRGALGGRAIKEPKFNFGNTTSDQALFQKTAYVLENTGVHAYQGQGPNLKNGAYVRAALSILPVEARHASVIGLIIKQSDQGITPDGAFNKPLSANAILHAVKATGFLA